MKKYKVYYSIVNNGSIEIEADGMMEAEEVVWQMLSCLLYTSPSPRDS